MVINLHRPDTSWRAPFSRGFSTDQLHLRPFDEQDFSAVCSILGIPAIYEHVDLSGPDEGLAWFASVRDKQSHCFLVVCPLGQAEILGLIIIQADPDKTLRLGGFFRPEHWSRGHASDILTVIRGLNRSRPLYADIDRQNTRALGLMAKTCAQPTGRSQGNTLEYRL